MCFMTFNDFWHISAMMDTSKQVLPFGQWRAPRVMREGGIFPHSACRSGHLSGVMHGLALRAMSLRDDVSLFEQITRPTPQWRATEESIQEEISGWEGRTPVRPRHRRCRMSKHVLGLATIVSMTVCALRIIAVGRVALQCEPPMSLHIFLIFSSFSFQPIALQALQFDFTRTKA